MELTKEHKRKIEEIVAAMDCPRGFSCYKSKFENLPPVTIWRGANILQCQQAARLNCPKSAVLSSDIVFCKCPLRKYLALHLEDTLKVPHTI